MKRDFSEEKVTELWEFVESCTRDMISRTVGALEECDLEGDFIEAAAGLAAVNHFLDKMEEKEIVTAGKLEQIIVDVREVDKTYGGYLKTLNDQLDAYDCKVRSVAGMLKPEKLTMNPADYRKELQAISSEYNEAKENSDTVKIEMWLNPNYQLTGQELEEAQAMVEAYFALGTDEARVYYEDEYSPVEESVYADWTEIHWKKFQLMGALDEKIGTLNSFGNGVVEAVPFWGTLSDLTAKNRAGQRGYEFEKLCLSDSVFANSHIQHPYVTFGGNFTGSMLTYELAAGAAGAIPGLSQRISSLSGRLSTFPILRSIGQDHLTNIIGATFIDNGAFTIPRAIGDILEGKSAGNVFQNAGLDIGQNLLFNIGGEAISSAVGKVLKGSKGSLNSERIEYYLGKSRNNIDSDTVILGSIGKYDVIAENEGYTYFKMSDEIWASLEKEAGSNYDEIWKVNKNFIDEQIASNKNILLSNDPYKGYYFDDGAKRFYQREIDYIISQGYIFEATSEGLWKAVRK